jgi:hypothetical protein
MTTYAEPPVTSETKIPDQLHGPYDPEMKEAGQLTSPTWELELFLSGAFVFATFQLPGLIESAYSRIAPHVTDATEPILLDGVLYAKAIAFTLVAMFSIHLVMRAYWVALMGVHSVFPKGIRWSELKVGPIARDVYRSRTREISKLIASLDNVCSVVFSVGLLVVLLFGFSTFMLGTASGIGYLIAHTIGGGKNTELYAIGVLLLVFAVPLAARLWEKRLGDDIDVHAPRYRVLRRIISLSYSMTLMRILGPMMFTLMSNVGRRKSVAALYGMIVILLAATTVDRLVSSDALSANTYDYFASSRTHEVNYRFYENQREAGKPYSRLPSIQSDLIRDPYVKLFIPYYPRRDNGAIARVCPSLRPLQDRGLQFGADEPAADSLTEPVLRCIAQMHAVKLDGAAIANLDFAFYEQQESGLKGFIAYIPLDSAARGRHVLEVLPTPPVTLPKDTAQLRAAAWKQPYVIPFWR